MRTAPRSPVRPLPSNPFAAFLIGLALALSACGAPAELPEGDADAGFNTPPDAGSGGEADGGTTSPEEQARLDSAQGWIDQAVASQWTPGIAVAIVREDGEHVLTAGTLGWDNARPVDADTIFELGSISKTFTALTLAQSVGLGEVTLSQTAQSLLPEAATLRKGPGGEEITLEQLATHRSGLPREVPGTRLDDPERPYGQMTPEQLFASLKDVPLAAAPGARYAYSNLGAGLLGHLTPRAAQMGSYEELVLRRVLLPLGMTRTFVSPPSDENLAMGHSESAKVGPVQFSIVEGAGAVRASSRDMVRYVRAQLHAKAGRDELLPEGLGEALRLAMTQRAQTGLSGYGLGLGWFTGWPSPSLPDATEVVHHGGLTFGQRAMMVVSPADGLGVVILANSTTLPDEALAANLIRLWRGEPRTFNLRATVVVPEDTLQRYVGVYEFNPATRMTVTREADRVFIQLTGQPRVRVYPHTETAFHARVVEATVTFRLDEGGEVVGLTLQQNGQTIEAPRLP